MFVVETVPYTNRTHSVLRPSWAPAIEGCKSCEYLFAGFNLITNKISGAVHTILGSRDEESVRVNRIINKISGAAHRCMGNKANQSLEWQVVVLEDDGETARYMGRGWILISTGLLGRLSSDAEIAFVLAHEVAHVIAKHSLEKFRVLHKLIPTFLAASLYQRQELEADYIGVMLLAASRFDPHAALRALEKAGKTTRKSSFFSPSTHPSWKKRSRFLSRRKLMEAAMELYTQAISGSGFYRGFLCDLNN